MFHIHDTIFFGVSVFQLIIYCCLDTFRMPTLTTDVSFPGISCDYLMDFSLPITKMTSIFPVTCNFPELPFYFKFPIYIYVSQKLSSFVSFLHA